MATESPRVFTIPASAPFLPTLIEALLDGRLVPDFPKRGDPLALAEATLYLPTRRACRLARDAFLDVMKEDAAILPRILPIGDIDEDEIAFAEAATGTCAADALEAPRALGGLARKMLLAELIRKWAAQPDVRTLHGVPLVANNPASILALADELARLLDDMTTRSVPWDKLDGLVPEDMDVYWQLTLRFLKIARAEWPKVLAAHGAIEPMARRDLMIVAEAKRLTTASGPVIAAGSTGSMPSTASLLATIAHLPRGAVVLPGLDTDLDLPSWERIGGGEDDAEARPVAGHPQFALHGLLRKIGIARDEVRILGRRLRHGREMLVSEALRPAAATERWQERLADRDFTARAEAAMADVTVIEAANAEDEALAIAIALREAVDDGSTESRTRTAALITPDRALARRVLAALERWGVPVDDSGGDSLADTPAGQFARLAALAALGGTEPVVLLSLLKHPCFRLGGHEFGRIGAIEALECAVLRGPRPRRGSAGLIHALQTLRAEQERLHASDPRKALGEAELDAAATLASDLAAALAPLEKLSSAPLPFATLAACHRDVIEALSVDKKGTTTALEGRDGDKLAEVFAEVAETAEAAPLPLSPSDYPDAFAAILSNRIVRRPGAPGSRVRILGPLEARMQQADRVVLGGLVEGIWPPEPRADPWLSRPMRHDLGLDLPERRIGLSAHDFAQALGAREIVLSRPAKREGAPAVASRFLQRLTAVAGEQSWSAAIARGNAYLEWGRGLDQPKDKPQACKRPAPVPPREARPMSLSVTEIEHWLRDPYTIYAKHILRLRPLDAVDTPPGARDRGNVIHAALGDFTEKFASALPADPHAELLALGRTHFAPLQDYEEAKAFWWPRFERIARWFAEWERRRRIGVAHIRAELNGRYEFTVGDRRFVLRARADRIERLADGQFAILDYKTGQIPSDKQVKIGLAPQLTLEAAILRQGGFADTSPAGASLKELVYIGLKGDRDGGSEKPVKFEDSTPDAEADTALAKLKALVAAFDNDRQAYYSLSVPMWKARYGDYDHLARIKEWSATGGEDDAE